MRRGRPTARLPPGLRSAVGPVCCRSAQSPSVRVRSFLRAVAVDRQPEDAVPTTPDVVRASAMGQGITSQAALLEMLRVQAAAAAHVDELVTTAQRWLYDRCRLIPGQRQISDMARHAFSAYKAQMLAAVNRAVPAATLQHCMESVRSPRADGSATHLEWIKAPSRVEFCHRPRLGWLALQRLPRSCMATVERTAYAGPLTIKLDLSAFHILRRSMRSTEHPAAKDAAAQSLIQRLLSWLCITVLMFPGALLH